MKDLPEYNVSRDEVTQLLSQQAMIRLVTVDAAGWPRIGLHVFVPEELSVEMHLASNDPQVDDLRRTGRAVIEVDRLLASSPSYWVDRQSAAHGDQYYECAVLRGEPELSSARADVAAHLRALVARYQPEGGYQEIADNSALYSSYFDRLTVVRLRPTGVLTKFKLLQAGSPSARTGILDGLAKRAGELDHLTATAIARASSTTK